MVTVLPPCIGDCDRDGNVTIDEIVTGLNIAQQVAPLAACVPMDANRDAAVTVNELVSALNNALYGCPKAGGGEVLECD